MILIESNYDFIIIGIIIAIIILFFFIKSNDPFIRQIEQKQKFYKMVKLIKKYNQANRSLIGLQYYRIGKWGK